MHCISFPFPEKNYAAVCLIVVFKTRTTQQLCPEKLKNKKTKIWCKKSPASIKEKHRNRVNFSPPLSNDQQVNTVLAYIVLTYPRNKFSQASDIRKNNAEF